MYMCVCASVHTHERVCAHARVCMQIFRIVAYVRWCAMVS